MIDVSNCGAMSMLNLDSDSHIHHPKKINELCYADDGGWIDRFVAFQCTQRRVGDKIQ